MKISTKGRYGLRILLDLALRGSDKPRMIRDIAASQQISEKYIGRLMIDLRAAGMVKSVRGARGGYRLTRLPCELTLLEILEAMEGPIGIVDCVNSSPECTRRSECAVRDIWCDVNEKIRRELARVSLQDILDAHCRKFADSSVPDYCI